MMQESKPILYEISYFLQAISPEESAGKTNLVSDMIEKEHGVIASQIQPVLKPLSYPIQKKTEAYWGWLKFMAKPEVVTSIKENLKARPEILRFMLVRAKKEELIEQPLRKRRRPVASPEKQAKIEEIDKKLEEILGE
ncbi:30S ribosomal protein S6 [Patescibacteria group bacterium]|nr:30S ribosomal protein S6 [Patescibacteria group bacterium]